MPDLTSGYTYTSGAPNNTVSHTNLNNLVANASINTGVITTAKLEDGAVTNVKVDNSAAIAFSKLASLDDGYLLVGSSGDVATKIVITGDIAITNAGVTTIQANAVTTAKILDANVTTGKLADSTGASDGVTTVKLATGAVTGPKIAMTSDAHGDILIRGASNYERLGTGTDGQVLTAGGADANPTWEDNPPASQVIYASPVTDATWTNSTNANIIHVRVIGGAGGQGGSSGGVVSRGQVGGRGASVSAFLDVSGVATVTYTVGAGGDGGTVGGGGGQHGAAGSDSSFGSYLTAGGGRLGTDAYYGESSGYGSYESPASTGVITTTEATAVNTDDYINEVDEGNHHPSYGIPGGTSALRVDGKVTYGICVARTIADGNGSDGNDGAIVITVIS